MAPGAVDEPLATSGNKWLCWSPFLREEKLRRDPRPAMRGEHPRVLDTTHMPPERASRIPGSPDVSVTGAVVQYRQRHRRGAGAEALDDIGVALVLEGECASACYALDLGSTVPLELDLSSELVVLGWVGMDTLADVRKYAADAGRSGRAPRDAGPFCFGVALRALRTLGCSSVTRPSLLRIGFRDVLRDLDPDGARQVRFEVRPGQIARVSLDAEGNTLNVVLTPSSDLPDADLESALTEAFPTAVLRKMDQAAGSYYQVRLPLPLGITELRGMLQQIRAGLAHLFWKFEPERSQVVAEQLATFGRRDSLGRLGDPAPSAQTGEASPYEHPSQVVH